MKYSRSFTLAALASALSLPNPALAQEESTTEGVADDVIWHNRYHAILAMSAYGDYETLCPQQTFNQAGLQKNFPGSTMQPFTLIEKFGPTAHGAEGYTVIIPEMAKVVLVFKGDYNREKNLPEDVASLDALPDMGSECPGCTANAYALTGYLEAKAETNNWEKSIAAYREIVGRQIFHYSITGHGLGGMHSVLASLDLGNPIANISHFHHDYNSPRTLNPAGAAYFNRIYGGDMTEKGITNNSPVSEYIPVGDNYASINTGFYYWGEDPATHMKMHVCYEAPDSPDCQPKQPYSEVDHYFMFCPVGQCGGRPEKNDAVAQAYIDSQSSNSSAVASAISSQTSALSSTLAALTSSAVSSTSSTSASSSAASTSTAASDASSAETTASPSSTDDAAAAESDVDTSAAQAGATGVGAAAAAGAQAEHAAQGASTSSAAQLALAPLFATVLAGGIAALLA